MYYLNMKNKKKTSLSQVYYVELNDFSFSANANVANVVLIHFQKTPSVYVMGEEFFAVVGTTL